MQSTVLKGRLISVNSGCPPCRESNAKDPLEEAGRLPPAWGQQRCLSPPSRPARLPEPGYWHWPGGGVPLLSRRRHPSPAGESPERPSIASSTRLVTEGAFYRQAKGMLVTTRLDASRVAETGRQGSLTLEPQASEATEASMPGGWQTGPRAPWNQGAGLPPPLPGLCPGAPSPRGRSSAARAGAASRHARPATLTDGKALGAEVRAPAAVPPL